MKQLPCHVIMLANTHHFEPGVQVASDLGEYVRFLANSGIDYNDAHSQVDEWIDVHGRVLIGITPAITHAHSFGAQVDTGRVSPEEGMPEGGMANAYLLRFTPSQSESADPRGHQMLFVIPALDDKHAISMHVWPPHAKSSEDCITLPNYDRDMLDRIQGRPAKERLLDTPLAPHVRSALN